MTTIAVLADLHLTDKDGTIQHRCLEWAVSRIRSLKPDAILLIGDMTSYGSGASAEKTMNLLRTCDAPIVSTPGNAERRCKKDRTAVSIFSSNPSFINHEIAILTVDSSEDKITDVERARVEKEISLLPGSNVIMATHCLPGSLDEDSSRWMGDLLSKNNIKLLLCAHNHRDRTLESGSTLIRIVRGLDPEKAIGGPPCMAIMKYSGSTWSIEDLPFPDADISVWSATEADNFLEHLGLALINKDGILEDMDYAIANRIPCIELRHSATELDKKELISKIAGWRSNGGKILSWHLPNIKFDGNGSLLNKSDWDSSCAAIHDLNCQYATLHPPRTTAGQMRIGSESRTEITKMVVDLINRLPQEVILSIENLHMLKNEASDDNRGFGYVSDELTIFLEELKSRLNPSRRVGILLDCGHVRNNGIFSTLHPLGDWFSDVGKLTVGYHIHQVIAKVDGKTNHSGIESIYGPLISYAGFFQAWRTGIINRCPVFIEVRGQKERYSSYENIRKILDRS